MDYGYSGIGGMQSIPNDCKTIAMPSLKTRLEQSVEEAQARLADAVRAREIFNAHPELEELLNIMQRGRF